MPITPDQSRRTTVVHQEWDDEDRKTFYSVNCFVNGHRVETRQHQWPDIAERMAEAFMIGGLELLDARFPTELRHAV